jgi:hypothetical protein
VAAAVNGAIHAPGGALSARARAAAANGYARVFRCRLTDPMTRSVDDLLSELQGFAPTTDGADNVYRLNEVLAGFAELPGCERVAPALLDLLERHPQADFGTPGPLVHALENQPRYPALLAASLDRQPTELTAWMANRLLNSRLPRDDRGVWLKRLTDVTSHPKAAPGVRDSAIRFLDFQASRQGR